MSCLRVQFNHPAELKGRPFDLEARYILGHRAFYHALGLIQHRFHEEQCLQGVRFGTDAPEKVALE